MDRDNLEFHVQWLSITGTTETSTVYVQSHILSYDTLEKYLQTFIKNMKFLDYEVLFKIPNQKFAKRKFESIWHKSYLKITKDKTIISITEQQTKLTTLGIEILQSMRTNQN